MAAEVATLNAIIVEEAPARASLPTKIEELVPGFAACPRAAVFEEGEHDFELKFGTAEVDPLPANLATVEAVGFVAAVVA